VAAGDIPCKYNGLSRCTGDNWEAQKECEYAQKSFIRNACLWMRPDDCTCSHPRVCELMKNGP